MYPLNCLMLDLKSYYPSPAHQLGLVVAYASAEPEVKKNMKFTFLEFARERPAQDIADAILTAKPDLVCASNYAWNYQKIGSVLDILVKSGEAVPRVVLGGPNSPGSFGASMLERYPTISGMVEGEGEPGFRDICSALVDSPLKNPFVEAKNCVYRDESGKVLRPNLGHRIQSLDDVPSPYLTGILPVSPSPIFYETNRGCPYRCSFCYWGVGGSKIYRMSLERVREEMEFFAQNRVSSFWLTDANFGIFPSDMEIAEMMSSINARHGYPFKHVGVNWAKNSSDRVLEIAGIFKKGRIACTTTLALQSVTPEAAEMSHRYSMAPSKFSKLISMAYEKNLDTYTDIICGLPGESIEEHLSGLDAVISTGVPAILIHQLALLPGTELFEKRQELGLVMLSEAGTTVPPLDPSDYWDSIVVSHPKMSPADMRRGARNLGISHMLHNHDLGRVVNFYLSRYGIVPSMVYSFMDEVLQGNVASFRPEENDFYRQVSGMILDFGNNVGRDEFLFYGRLSEIVWYKKVDGKLTLREPELRSFMLGFYEAFCAAHGICKEAWELELLRDLVSYNVVICPKPGWKPNSSYDFTYDVHAIWDDMLTQILRWEDVPERKPGIKGSSEAWPEHAEKVRSRLSGLLTPEYLASKRRASNYAVKNPWFKPPANNADWLLSSRSKHCIISYLQQDTALQQDTVLQQKTALPQETALS